MNGIGKVGEDDLPRRGGVSIPVSPLLVGDAEVFFGAGGGARGDARSVLRQRSASTEVLVGHFLECGPRAELHHDVALTVPPTEARNLRVVAVQDAGLRKRGSRRDAAPVGGGRGR